MKERGRRKGLLALLLCICMLVGTSMTVFAQDYSAWDLAEKFAAGQDVIVTADDRITGAAITGGCHWIPLYLNEQGKYEEGGVSSEYNDEPNDVWSIPAPRSGYRAWKLVNYNYQLPNNSYLYFKPYEPPVSSQQEKTADKVQEPEEPVYEDPYGDINTELAEFAVALSKAKPGGEYSFDMKYWMSINKTSAEALRNAAVPVTLYFANRGTCYRFTIPAGTDMTALLDENGYAGMWYLSEQFGRYQKTDKEYTLVLPGKTGTR